MLRCLLLAAALLFAPTALAQEAPAEAPQAVEPLLNPADAPTKCPRTFDVLFQTTAGDFIVQVDRKWAPNGALRFYHLVGVGFYDGAAFFRAVNNFMVQFGINGTPEVDTAWQDARIPDDPVVESNRRGMVTFAMAGPDTRTTQVFINLVNKNYRLDEQGFSPFGKVIQGMSVVESLYMGYGDAPPGGAGPKQDLLRKWGNAYLDRDFPKLDRIKSARVIK